MLHYLTGWLVGFVWWRKGCVEAREGLGERGQGCFLFSQLIDSQMSGGVGFGAWLKHPGTRFLSTNKHLCTPMRTQPKTVHVAAHVHVYLWPVFLSHTPLQ